MLPTEHCAGNRSCQVIFTFHEGTTMKTRTAVARDIDEYIAGFPPDVQRIMEQIRATIRRAAPGTEESISYRIPAFKLHGTYLVYFAGFKKHIGLYPAPVNAPELKNELAPYAAGKATVQFQLDEPIPFGLITKIVKSRAKENLNRAAAKTKRKRSGS
jgi:uncharacterized protein YdhG (YjbR/CyaY superfamily)